MKTIKDIAREMRRRALDFKGGNLPAEAVIAAGEDMEMFADLFEAAHKREMAHYESLLQKAGALVAKARKEVKKCK